MRRILLCAFVGLLALVPASAIAKPGDLIVAEYASDEVSRVKPGTGAVSLIGDDPDLDAASYLTLEPKHRIVVTDESGGSLFRINAGTGDAVEFYDAGGSPYGIDRAPDGRLVVFDYDTGILWRVNSRSGDRQTLASGDFMNPQMYGLDVLPSGSTLITDQSGGGRIIRVSGGGDQSIFSDDPDFVSPADIARAPNGELFAVDQADGLLFGIDPLTKAAEERADGLGNPYGLAVAPNGIIYTTDHGGAVNRVNPDTGNVTPVATVDLDGPVGIEIEPPSCAGQWSLTVGSTGRDRLRGSRFADVVHGHNGGDSIKGGTGGDRLCGGKGDDRILDTAGKNRIDCGAGKDRAIVNARSRVRRCEVVTER